MESPCSQDGTTGGAGDCSLFFFGVVFFNVHDKVSVTGVHGWRGSCAGLRFPLNGPFRWARHLTRPATTSPAILHYGRWLWLFPFIPASVRRHVSAEWPGHVIKGNDETALDPLFTRAQGHSIRYSVLKSCSSVLTNSKLQHFHSVLVVLRFTFGCWMSGEKSPRIRKIKNTGSGNDCCGCCNMGSFIRNCFFFLLSSLFVNFRRCFFATKDEIIWNYMLEFLQLVIPPESCWSSSEMLSLFIGPVFEKSEFHTDLKNLCVKLLQMEKSSIKPYFTHWTFSTAPSVFPP